MLKHGIPTAKYEVFNSDNLSELQNFIGEIDFPIVVKADGLAAGKGVIICNNQSEADECVRELTEEKIFGTSGLSFVVEEFLQGNEVSLFIITDGDDYVILPSAQDHKRIGEGDTGKNTGGMGAYSPADKYCDEEMLKKIEDEIIKPTLKALKSEGRKYKGCLYAGLMITSEGKPYVIEFNCRFGDPETQAVLQLVESDFLELLIASSESKIKDYKLETKKAFAGCVVLASGGYPDDFEKDKLIEGLSDVENCLVFHAGTNEKAGKIYTSGGRVLSVVSVSDKSFNSAFDNIYCAIEKINFDKKYFRKDIGYKVL